ncbi:MAG: hypothetical protein K9N55_19350 [Phycisphaerae bacterium]|nr:hypothetical protein [Phycisphaerae bacterium]
MDTYTRPISIMDPIGPSLDHTKAILFAPFDLNRWLAIGFCAWVASLGEGGGPSFNYKQTAGEANQWINKIDSFLASNPMIIGVLVVLSIVVAVVMIWLSSRGRFMFYHCVLYNSDQVVHPWHYYQHLAYSLFRFRLVLLALGIVFAVAVASAAISIFGPTLQAITLHTLWPFLLYVPLLAIVPLGLIICGTLTHDFVIPIMHKHTLTCTAAWSQLWSMIAIHKVDFFLYLLFKALVAVAVSSAIFFLALITCGCACCLAALPYVGTVLLLPVPTFKRAFALHYLRQFGPDFDLFVSEPDPNQDEPDPTPDHYAI